MKRLLLLLALAQVVSAEEFFARNRPFKAVEKRQGVWTAGLADLARALELPLTQVGAAWILGAAGEEEPGEAGVYFNGKKLACVDAEMRVPVQAFLQEVGGRYIENKAMGSVDLYAPSKMLSKGVTCNNVHLLMFHKTEANGQQVASFGESFQTRGLEPVPIDFQDTSHPLWQQWNKYFSAVPMPYVVLVDPSGRVLGRWNGKLPPQAQVQQMFSQFVSSRAALNAQQVAMPSNGGGGGGFSGG
ncbi:MAG: hypothetical protein J0I12_16335 [Candidatus Eremiobacteraeota bacterium]|nr:hypothetical protein [Candidatus Eremiobacteraeota bacterium]